MIGDDTLVEGIILAGGKASRMKQNKMLLPYKSKPILYHTINSMITHCNKITIVTGYYNLDYLDIINAFKHVEVVHNAQHELGMFSSIKKAIKNVTSDFFLIPGDYPLVKESTYQKLIDADGLIRVPVFKGRRGHPIYISQALLEGLKKEPIDSNLKVWRDKHIVNYIDVDDEGTIHDIDTILEYKQLVERNDGSEN